MMNYFLFKDSEKSVYEDFCPYHYMVRKNSTATSSVNENKLRDPLRVRNAICNDCQNDELKQIMKREILNQLISLSTVSCHDKHLQKAYIMPARKELSDNLPKYLSNAFTTKQRLSAIWVAVWPASYRWIHTAYARITGLDKKYEVS